MYFNESPIFFPLLSFIIMAIIVFGVIFFTMIKQWNKNRYSPKLVVNAKVVEKRIKISKFLNQGGEIPRDEEFESCYVIFQLDNGEQIELWVKRSIYLKLSKGDRGKLSFQGTKYLGFEKNN